MARNNLILGASYGSAGDKLLMAGHNVTLFAGRRRQSSSTATAPKFASSCATRRSTARSSPRDLPGTLDAITPGDVNVSRYDMVGLPCRNRNTPTIRSGLSWSKSPPPGLPCLSIMNMPPLPLSKAEPGTGGNDLKRPIPMRRYRSGSSRGWYRFARRSAGFPSAGRRSQRASCRPATGSRRGNPG